MPTWGDRCKDRVQPNPQGAQGLAAPEGLEEMSTQRVTRDVRPVSHRTGGITAPCRVGLSQGSLKSGLRTLLMTGREAAYRVARYFSWGLGVERVGLARC